MVYKQRKDISIDTLASKFKNMDRKSISEIRLAHKSKNVGRVRDIYKESRTARGLKVNSLSDASVKALGRQASQYMGMIEKPTLIERKRIEFKHKIKLKAGGGSANYVSMGNTSRSKGKTAGVPISAMSPELIIGGSVVSRYYRNKDKKPAIRIAIPLKPGITRDELIKGGMLSQEQLKELRAIGVSEIRTIVKVDNITTDSTKRSGTSAESTNYEDLKDINKEIRELVEAIQNQITAEFDYEINKRSSGGYTDLGGSGGQTVHIIGYNTIYYEVV